MSDDFNLDQVLSNIKIMKEYDAKIKAKLATETNSKLREQAFREYAPLDYIISTFGSLINDEDFTNLYKEKNDGSKQQTTNNGSEENTGRTSS
jgi:hypothetical protein